MTPTPHTTAGAQSTARPPALGRGLLTHEWIERTGGSEKVLDQLAIAFPGTPIVCLWNEDPDRYPGRAVHESPLARTPLRGRKASSAPLLPAVWAGHWHELVEADWILMNRPRFSAAPMRLEPAG